MFSALFLAFTMFAPSASAAGAPGVVIHNPGNYTTFSNFTEAILGVVLRIGVPILVLMMIFSGLSFVLARGNEKKIEDAKNTLIWTIIGAAILLGAWTLAKMVAATIAAIAP